MFYNSDGVEVFKKSDISELENLLLKDNKLQIVSYKDLQGFTKEQISQFCVQNGFYTIPTLELISFLQEEIKDVELNQVLEIGAGHGAISKALNIRAVDSFMQDKEEIKEVYNLLRQTPVPYGEHVEKYDGNDAIRRFKPKIVIGAYCTHKYNPKEHWRGGNAFGFNEKLILERVEKYIHVGNRHVHNKKPILKYKHREIKEDWIVTRSFYPKDNIIWIWEK